MGVMALGAALFAGPSIYQQREQERLGRRSLRMQERANQEAKAAAIRTARQNDMALNMANQKKPDIAAIMATAVGGMKPNTSTVADPLGIRLGKTSLLGNPPPQRRAGPAYDPIAAALTAPV